MISIGMVVSIRINGISMKVVMDGVNQRFDWLFFLKKKILNPGNNELEYYTNNRQENARCELFPGSPNGRLIIEARKVTWSYFSLRVQWEKNFLLGRIWRSSLYFSSYEKQSFMDLRSSSNPCFTSYRSWPLASSLDGNFHFEIIDNLFSFHLVTIEKNLWYSILAR